jgi:hypothetical protein
MALWAQLLSESDTDQDSDEGTPTGFIASRYEEAQIAEAIIRPHDYVRATQELRLCILRFYSRFQMSKEMRHIIEKDATQAFLVHDR